MYFLILFSQGLNEVYGFIPSLHVRKLMMINLCKITVAEVRFNSRASHFQLSRLHSIRGSSKEILGLVRKTEQTLDWIIITQEVSSPPQC